MPSPSPLFASERTAAKLLDMKPSEFMELVELGVLPKPFKIGERIVRWSVKDLEAIRTGAAMESDFTW